MFPSLEGELAPNSVIGDGYCDGSWPQVSSLLLKMACLLLKTAC